MMSTRCTAAHEVAILGVTRSVKNKRKQDASHGYHREAG
jgi:hypothetical protein